MNEVTLEFALKKVQNIIDKLKNDYQKIVVIGYSVGATIAWLSSINKHCNGIIGFYGSRIRNYCHINPLCPTLLIFAEKEKSFDVEKLKTGLLEKENVDVKSFSGEHGFADRYCDNHNEVFLNQSRKLVKDFLKRINGDNKDFI